MGALASGIFSDVGLIEPGVVVRERDGHYSENVTLVQGKWADHLQLSVEKEVAGDQ